MSRTLLVTGSIGSIGRATVCNLLDSGAKVRAFTHREDRTVGELLRKQGAQIIIKLVWRPYDTSSTDSFRRMGAPLG